MFDDLAERIKQMQVKARERAQKRNPSAALKRGFHAKGTGVRAKFQVRSELPSHLQVGFFQPGATYEALVRFSNARGEVLGDLSKDQRGVAIRLKTDPDEKPFAHGRFKHSGFPDDQYTDLVCPKSGSVYRGGGNPIGRHWRGRPTAGDEVWLQGSQAHSGGVSRAGDQFQAVADEHLLESHLLPVWGLMPFDI